MINRFVVLACSVFVLSACSSDGKERPDYLDSYTIKALEVPPTLTKPDTTTQLDLPEPSDKALSMLKQREKASVKGEVAPVFSGIELKSDQNMHWLEVQEDADKLWPVLKKYWAHEGIVVVREEPLLGFMETEWIKDYKPNSDESFLVTMFKKLSPDRRDKFRMRVERIVDRPATKIFISHQGLEVFIENDISSWRERASDPNLEYEMLRRLVLFAGLSEGQTEQMFADYTKPYQTRIRKLPGNDRFELIGDANLVWDRVLHAIDQIGVEVVAQDRQQGSIDVRVKNVPEKLVNTEDDLEESNWLVRLFTGGPGDEQIATGEVTVNVMLQPGTNTVQMTLRHAGAAIPNIGLAARFEEALVKLLN